MVFDGTHDFHAYSVGVCHASVCTAIADIDTITRRLNLERPTGVGPWLPSTAASFKNGMPNPCPCNEWPATHKHYLFEC